MGKRVLISIIPVIALAILAIVALVSTSYQSSANGAVCTDTVEEDCFEEVEPQYKDDYFLGKGSEKIV